MASGTVVIIKVRNHVPPERELVQDDYMVEVLPADRANQSFHVWALPRRPERSENFLNVHAFCLLPEGGAIDAIPIAE